MSNVLISVSTKKNQQIYIDVDWFFSVLLYLIHVMTSQGDTD